MARIDKMKISKSLENELGRDEMQQEELESHYFKNNVNRARTNLNYRLIDNSNKSLQELIDDRLQGVYVRQIKGQEPIKAFSVICTLPQGEYTQEQEQAFFEQSLKFLQERYGEKNVLQGYVHKDETQPHAHFVVVPIVEIDKTYKGVHYDEKLCAKEVINPQDFKTFHKDYQKYIGQEYKVVSEEVYQGCVSFSTSNNEQKRTTSKDLLQGYQKREKRYKAKINELEESNNVKQSRIEEQQEELQKVYEVVQDLNTILEETSKVITPQQYQTIVQNIENKQKERTNEVEL